MLRLYVNVSLTDDDDGFHVSQEVQAGQVAIEERAVYLRDRIRQMVSEMIVMAEGRIQYQADERVELASLIADGAG